MKLNFKKLNNIIPAIIEDAQTNKVLMLGFMNKQALDKTIKTKLVTFYSRGKKRLWTKGETSGNYLEVLDIKTDCDKDSLLIKVKPQGPTCHRNKYSCFGEDKKDSLKFLSSLYILIKQRKRQMPPNSYTASLFKQGQAKILEKIKEEAQEIIKAAKSEGKDRTIEEISDFLYHLMALMVESGISWEDIVECLKNRQK
jgi:phosphoribosyl-ATP pyrophosphohydrolase/phosphoribosyl-AMP cyclohydrolase